MKAQQIVFPIFDQLVLDKKENRFRRRRVEEALKQVGQLKDELNDLLYSRSAERPSITSPKDAYEILKGFLEPLDHEELWVAVLDTRNRVMALVSLYRGSVNSSQIRVAEVFRKAILENAPAIVLAHNHPSGDPSPSPDDIAITKELVKAGKLLDIQVLDHLVIGQDRFVSLKERDLGFS